MTTRTHYIVKLICDYNDTSKFEIVKDKPCWLCYTEEGGGFFTISGREDWAKKFDKEPSRTFIMSCSGRPWYYRIKRYEIFKVTEEVKSTKVKL